MHGYYQTIEPFSSATWTGINTYIEGIDNSEISNTWLASNIQQNHGPLGAIYPDVAWGVEGDTPAFLPLIPNGLNNPEHPNWGGWGGRYEFYKPDFSLTKEGGSIVEIAPETRKIWTNATDTYTPHTFREYGRTFKAGEKSFTGFKETLWRWRLDFQNDFAARMDWTIKPYNQANHPPVAVLSHADTLTVESGKGFTLDASKSSDPDGDSLGYLWFNYPEAGTFQEPHPVGGADNAHAIYITAPTVTRKETLHYILKLTDKGTPALSRYKRIIVHVVPK